MSDEYTHQSLRPVLPPVPDVVPYEDELAREVLRKWAEDYADAFGEYVLQLAKRNLA